MRTLAILTALTTALALAPLSASAAPNHCSKYGYPVTTMSAVGDSISCGFDSRDGNWPGDTAKTLFQYADRLGWDWSYSWTVGDSSGGFDSVKSRLNSNAVGLGTSTYVYFPGRGRETTESGMYGTAALGDSPVIAPKNGSRWDDANSQAQAILSYCNSDPSSCPQVITIELGGNDVCQGSCASYPPCTNGDCLADYGTTVGVRNHILNTIKTLASLPAPSDGTPREIWIASVPNIDNLRQSAAGKRNFLFRTCQDVWNLDTTKIDVNLCDWGFWDWICDIGDWIVNSTAKYVLPLVKQLLKVFDWMFDKDVVGTLQGITFPCWSMNYSGASSGSLFGTGPATTCRSLGIQLNSQINDHLYKMFCSPGGGSGADNATACATGVFYDTNGNVATSGNVKFYHARGVKGLAFSQSHVSTLDCFHPSRHGQKLLADTVWNDICGVYTDTTGLPRPALNGTTPITTTPCWHYLPNNCGSKGITCTKILDQYVFSVSTALPTQLCVYQQLAADSYNQVFFSGDTAKGLGCKSQMTTDHRITLNNITAGATVLVDLGDKASQSYLKTGYSEHTCLPATACAAHAYNYYLPSP